MIRPDPTPKATAPIDLARGLTPVREAWIEARGYASTQGRAIKPEDNGDVSADHLAPLCPATRTLRAGRPGELVTQLEFARAGIVTEEMIYVAHRENLAREAALEGAAERLADGESFGGGHPRIRHAGIRARARSRAGGRSFPPTSITSNSSRWRSAAIFWSRSTPTSAIRR